MFTVLRLCVVPTHLRVIRVRDRVLKFAASIGKPVAIAVITYIVMGGVSVASGIFPRPAVLDRVDPKRADLGRFVPADYTVTKRIISNLDGEGDAEVVLSLAGRQEDLLPRDVIILGYDRTLRRWVKVYDALEQAWSAAWRSTDDPSAKKFAPEVDNLSVGTIKLGKNRTDVAIGGNVSGGSTPQQRVDVVRFHDHVATSAYSFENLGPGTLTIAGNQLHVTTLWFTPYNAACCAERPYQFTVDPSQHYGVVMSDRPLLGAVVAGDDGSGLLVGSVVRGSPADGVLEPGDEVVGIDSSSTNSTGEEIAKAFSAHHPGDNLALSILRDGVLTHSVVRLGWRDLKPSPSRLAVVGATLSEDPRGGVVTVAGLARSGTLVTSGINENDRITAVGGRIVSRPAAVAAELQRALGVGDDTTAIELRGPRGTGSVEVWIDTTQEDFGGDAFFL
jgi:hypothetical protein